MSFTPSAAGRGAAQGDRPHREGERAATHSRAEKRSLGEELKKGRRRGKESPPPRAAPAPPRADEQRLLPASGRQRKTQLEPTPTPTPNAPPGSREQGTGSAAGSGGRRMAPGTGKGC